MISSLYVTNLLYIIYLHGEFALCEKLVVQSFMLYTSVVSLLYMRNSLYNIWAYN